MSNQSTSNFINLHTSGIGYIRRVRNVAVRKGGAFYAASISAMFGEKGVKDGVQYVPYDVKAVSEQAEQVLQLIQADANDQNKRVMVRFNIGDAYIDSFKHQSGARAGETGLTMKGRLLFVTHAWVKNKNDGDDQQGWNLVYELPKQQEEQPVKTGTEG